MNDHEYNSILTALDAALEVFEAHPVHFGFELETYERLRDLRDRTAAARTRFKRAADGAA